MAKVPAKSVNFQNLLSVLLLLSFALFGCSWRELNREQADRESPLPVEKPTPPPEDKKFEKGYRAGPTPTPLPLAIYGYSCEPRVFEAGSAQTQGQLAVFLSRIYYGEITPEHVSIELDGKPARGIEVPEVGLFEAQDVLIGLKITRQAKPGVYDARLRVGDQTFFLPKAFEIRAQP